MKNFTCPLHGRTTIPIINTIKGICSADGLILSVHDPKNIYYIAKIENKITSKVPRSFFERLEKSQDITLEIWTEKIKPRFYND